MSNRFSLDHLQTIALEGPDARAYAQSQFTVGIETLSEARWSPLAWCDSKGRVLSFMMALASEKGVELILPRCQVEPVRERLERFSIGRRIEISVSGPVAGTFEPGERAIVSAVDPERGLIAGEPAPSDAEALARWRQVDVCRGLPWLSPATSEQFLPQWLGLESLGALAYDKGCYPGQEVIARLHYRGTVKYRLTGLRLADSAELPQIPQVPNNARVLDRDARPTGNWLYGVNTLGIGLAVLSTRIDDAADVSIQADGQSLRARVTAPEALC